MIVTKYLKATNRSGARCKATHIDSGKYIITSWMYGYDSLGNHKAACIKLVDKLKLYDGQYQQDMAIVQCGHGSYAFGWYRIRSGDSRLTFYPKD